MSPGDLHMQMGFTKYRLDNNMTGNVPEVEAVYQSVLKDCLATTRRRHRTGRLPAAVRLPGVRSAPDQRGMELFRFTRRLARLFSSQVEAGAVLRIFGMNPCTAINSINNCWRDTP